MSKLPTAEDVREFWLGDTTQHAENLKAKQKLWFQKSFETDQAISERFLPLLPVLYDGLADIWAIKSPHDRIAAIIVLDQFSRNLFRGSAMAFSHDARALRLSKDALELGEEKQLSEIERVFLYLPFEHSEAIEDQETSVRLFTELYDNARPDYRVACKSFLDYAHAHKAVIDQFGRFPHRNEALKRKSTQEELDYLSQPGSGF